MTREDYIKLFYRANANLVAFKQVFHCDEELRKMVEIAIADEREACAKIVEHILKEGGGTYGDAIRARGNT